MESMGVSSPKVSRKILPEIRILRTKQKLVLLAGVRLHELAARNVLWKDSIGGLLGCYAVR
jgi:hypothetical protein